MTTRGAPRSTARRCVAGVVLACVLLNAAPAVVAARDSQKRVVVFYAARKEAPGPVAIEPELQRVFNASLGGRIDYYGEYFDMARFPDLEYQAALSDFLRRKYHGQPADVVMTIGQASTAFVLKHRDEIFPGVPLVFVDGGASLAAHRPPRSTGVSTGFDLARTLAVVSTLQPETKRVFVVSGASDFDKYYENAARAQFQGLHGRFEFTYLSGLSIEDLERDVARVPPQSVIYYLMVTEDGAGHRFLPLDVLDRVTAVANAPVYSWGEPGLDHGIVGGSMIKLELAARPAGELAVRLMAGDDADSIPATEVDMHVAEVDWRQIQRWGISEARIPKGTTIRFREPGAWERFRPYVVAAIGLVLFQSVLIAGLIVNRVRRRRAEMALRASYARIRDLAGRLINAQEVERARIARELHDDIGQRLASFSIAVGTMKRGLTGAGGGVQDELASLQRETTTLSRDLRQLSHDLHPALLEHLGLVEALRTRCEDVTAEAGIQVRLEVDPDLGPVSDAVALCLYRVVQEALRNVVGHARAQTAVVTLHREDGHLAMQIIDDGRGFEGSAAAGFRGLGLISLAERVRMLDGTFAIESSPRAGTTVRVTLPSGVSDAATTSADRG